MFSSYSGFRFLLLLDVRFPVGTSLRLCLKSIVVPLEGIFTSDSGFKSFPGFYFNFFLRRKWILKEAREVFLFHLKPRLLQRSFPVVQWSLKTYFQVSADKLAVANFPPSFFSVVLSLSGGVEKSPFLFWLFQLQKGDLMEIAPISLIKYDQINGSNMFFIILDKSFTKSCRESQQSDILA